MAQLEKSSVSPTKMQICPRETTVAIRALHLQAGREPPRLPTPPWGLHVWALRLTGVCRIQRDLKAGQQLEKTPRTPDRAGGRAGS